MEDDFEAWVFVNGPGDYTIVGQKPGCAVQWQHIDEEPGEFIVNAFQYPFDVKIEQGDFLEVKVWR